MRSWAYSPGNEYETPDTIFGPPNFRKRFIYLGWPKQYVGRIDRHFGTDTPAVSVTDTGRSVVNMATVGNPTGTAFDHDIIVGGGLAGGA